LVQNPSIDRRAASPKNDEGTDPLNTTLESKSWGSGQLGTQSAP
jgi:hypothetical protein